MVVYLALISKATFVGIAYGNGEVSFRFKGRCYEVNLGQLFSAKLRKLYPFCLCFFS